MLELDVGEPGRRVLRFPAAWLRDNCPCADCRDPLTGQRLLDLAGIADPVIASARHLQGCYADLDGPASTLSVLRGKAAS